jgi:hypothetical protein
MNWMVVIPAMLVLGATVPNSTEQELMDRIESSVVLPEGAYPLEDYGRYYTYSGEGRVTAVYLRPFNPPDSSDGCWKSSGEDLIPCTEEEREAANSAMSGMTSRRLGAGERRWVDDSNDLPFILDGGCTQVTIDYLIASNRFASVRCNGLA